MRAAVRGVEALIPANATRPDESVVRLGVAQGARARPLVGGGPAKR